jgi:ribosomal protein L30E
MSRDQNAGRSHNINIENTLFERVEEGKYLGTNETGQNSIQEEIKSSLKSGNAYCHSVKNIVSYSSLSKNIKIKIYRTVILTFDLCGCETWSLTLREERGLRVVESRVLRIFWSKRDRVIWGGDKYVMKA